MKLPGILMNFEKQYFSAVFTKKSGVPRYHSTRLGFVGGCGI
jgi:hypothetical protein